MSIPTDQDFEENEDNREDIIEVTEKIGEALPEDKSLVVSEDVFQILSSLSRFMIVLYFPKCFCR